MRISLSRLATVTLIVLVWSIPAYCSEIHDAVAAGDLAKVKALLKDNPDLISSRNNAGQTPLHLATEYGYRDIVELLLANKADVNAIVLAMMDTMAGKSFLWLKVGCTPLHIAAGNGRKDVAKLLLANGANVSANCQGVIRGMTPLHQAVIAGHKNVAELLLADGDDINVREKDHGNTLLHLAAWKGHREVAEFLLYKGANVNARNNDGLTPLKYAVSSGHKDLAELLRQHGGHE